MLSWQSSQGREYQITIICKKSVNPQLCRFLFFRKLKSQTNPLYIPFENMQFWWMWLNLPQYILHHCNHSTEYQGSGCLYLCQNSLLLHIYDNHNLAFLLQIYRQYGCTHHCWIKLVTLHTRITWPIVLAHQCLHKLLLRSYPLSYFIISFHAWLSNSLQWYRSHSSLMKALTIYFDWICLSWSKSIFEQINRPTSLPPAYYLWFWISQHRNNCHQST